MPGARPHVAAHWPQQNFQVQHQAFQQWAPAQPLMVQPPDEAQVDSFIAQWGLDDGCKKLLTELPADVQEEVMRKFCPKGEVRNPRGRFVAYVWKFIEDVGRKRGVRINVGGKDVGKGAAASPLSQPAAAFNAW